MDALNSRAQEGSKCVHRNKKAAFFLTSLYSSLTTTVTTALVTLYTARNRLVACIICTTTRLRKLGFLAEVNVRREVEDAAAYVYNAC